MKKSKEILKRKEKGITLIALVITIIVLLILAGVSIAMLTGQNGILSQAQNAKNKTEEAQVNEANALTNYEQIINASTGVNLGTITGHETTNTVTQDSLGNRVVIPAGFKVVNPNDNVEDGIIIEDVSHEATAGSQFVWIPVGTGIKKKDNSTFNVALRRYVYKEDGTIDTTLSKTEPTDQLNNSPTNSIYYTEGLNNSSTINTHAKDILTFISKVKSTGGYYIARYEARTKVERTASTNNEGLTQITVKPDEYLYNFVTQSQAASLSQNMYASTNFTSDLMNSYAWDTAIYFLQECDDRDGENNTPYSRQGRVISIFAPKGTNNEVTKDQICNIFDMASNCAEWSTETSSVSDCVYRSSGYFGVNNYTSARFGAQTNYKKDDMSFRPILYL